MPETLQQAFEAELNRLTALHIPDDELELARRYYSQKERESMSEGSFCGPHRSFPITSQADVDNTAHLVGHADNPDAVKACIKRKAKANGWSLPKSWTDGKSDRLLEADLERAKQAATHPPYTGRHSHGHPHEIDGYAHEHSHEHQNDNEHDHTHTHTNRAAEPEDVSMYLPITRIDNDSREVEGVATSEAIDTYGTVFSYEASKAAFKRWIDRTANVREMHERKAVGKGVGVRFDDSEKKIYVTTRVSRSADGDNTWIKIKEGILNGFSVGGGKPYVWESIERGGKAYPYLTAYNLAELSYVDNASNPDAQGLIYRGEGLTDLVDLSEPETIETPDLNRAGARVSHATQSDLHGLRDSHLQNAKKTMQICACDECAGGMSALDPDNDGDIDLLPMSSLDWDQDGGQSDMTQKYRNIEAEITRQLTPVVSRMQAILTQHIQLPQAQQLQTQEPVELTRHIEAMETRFHSELGEVRSLLSEVKGLAEKIANTPLPGGPVATPVPVDKRLATQPQGQGYNPNDDIAALQRAAKLVPLDQESQVRFAAEIIKRQRGN